jgi:hypothetical protein
MLSYTSPQFAAKIELQDVPRHYMTKANWNKKHLLITNITRDRELSVHSQFVNDFEKFEK